MEYKNLFEFFDRHNVMVEKKVEDKESKKISRKQLKTTQSNVTIAATTEPAVKEDFKIEKCLQELVIDVKRVQEDQRKDHMELRKDTHDLKDLIERLIKVLEDSEEEDLSDTEEDISEEEEEVRNHKRCKK